MMSAPEWHEGVPVNSSIFSFTGAVLLVIFGIGGGYWAVTAPLDSAVIAAGSFVATGANKVIQHLEGGIVEKILVKEGDRIKAGQVLVRLDRTRTDVEYARLRKKKIQLLVYRARLKWETGLDPDRKTGRTDHIFQISTDNDWLKGKDARTIIRAQQEELQAGLASRRNQVARLQKQVNAEQKKLTGTQNVHKAILNSISEMDRQINKIKKLIKRGIGTRGKLDSLALSRAQEETKLSETLSQQEQARERVLELEQAIRSIDLTNRQERIKELRETGNELADITERLVQARDITKRLSIRSPVDGIIVQMSLNTEGGIISPGQQVMEILPTNNQLQIQVFVTPTDIDDVSLGQDASVQLSALNQRTTPSVEGSVTYVSADAIQQKNGETSSYIVRINLNEADSKLAASLNVVPGMPVSVFIKTGSQTFWEYITRPIVDSLKRSAVQK